jgi:hypothetical protein
MIKAMQTDVRLSSLTSLSVFKKFAQYVILRKAWLAVWLIETGDTAF